MSMCYDSNINYVVAPPVCIPELGSRNVRFLVIGSTLHRIVVLVGLKLRSKDPCHFSLCVSVLFHPWKMIFYSDDLGSSSRRIWGLYG